MENTIKICGREFPLYYNTWVMQKIAEKCGGDIGMLGKWLSEGTTAEVIVKIAEVVALLVNGGIQKKNFAIECGLEKGELAKLIDEKLIVNIINPVDIASYKNAIFTAMAAGSDFVIPEGGAVETEDEDPDLKAIRAANAEKN